MRIDLSAFATSHVVPGGSAPATALSYRLLTESGVEGPDAGIRAGDSGPRIRRRAERHLLGRARRLVVHPRVQPAVPGRGRSWESFLIGAFAAVVLLLLEGRDRAVEVVHRLADKLPFLDGDRTAALIRRVADRMRALVDDRELLRRAVGWAAANWLFDAASLWVFIAAFGRFISPIDLLVAYGLANILAVIPITPGGLGVIEGVLIPTLSGFGGRTRGWRPSRSSLTGW